VSITAVFPCAVTSSHPRGTVALMLSDCRHQGNLPVLRCSDKMTVNDDDVNNSALSQNFCPALHWEC